MRVAQLWSSHRRVILVVSLAIALGLFLVSLPPNVRIDFVAGLLAQRTLVSLLLFFGLLTLSLLWSTGQGLDAWIFMRLNLRGYHPAWLDRLMWLITHMGNMVLAMGLALFFFLLGDRRLTFDIMLGVLTLWLAVETIKALTERARPFIQFRETRIIGRRQRGLSFPSGHTSQVFFLATLLAHRFELDFWTKIFLYGIAALVGFTRMYVGAHYPRDVVGGALLGSIWAIMSGLVNPYTVNR